MLHGRLRWCIVQRKEQRRRVAKMQIKVNAFDEVDKCLSLQVARMTLPGNAPSFRLLFEVGVHRPTY